jgi:hypothetical protein
MFALIAAAGVNILCERTAKRPLKVRVVAK